MKEFASKLFRSLTGRSSSCPAARPPRQTHLRLEALEDRLAAYANLGGYWILTSAPTLPSGSAPAALDVTSENTTTGTFSGRYFDQSRAGFPSSGVPVSGQLSRGPLYQFFGLDNMTFQGSIKVGVPQKSATWSVSFQGEVTDSAAYPSAQSMGGTLTESEVVHLGSIQYSESWSSDANFDGPAG
jgi:hypothetical protein